MKKHFLYLLFIFFCVSIYSQSPQKFTYQSIIRDSEGVVLKSSQIGIKLSILQTSSSGRSVYSEQHDLSTNLNGLVTLIIGDGNTSDSFSSIDWSTGKYFLKIEVDPLGGRNYLIEDTSQLLSVPYALYSGNSSSSNLLLSGEDYLIYSNNNLTLKKIDLEAHVTGTLSAASGGTGASSPPMIAVITAADAAAARTVLGVEAAGKDNSTAVTLKEITDNYLIIDGQEITAGLVPVSLGGSGVTSLPMISVITAADAAAARTILGVEVAGKDNSTAVTLKEITDNYLIIDGQEITAGLVPVSLGGSGVTSTNFIVESGATARTSLGLGSIATQNKDAVDVDGGAIDGTVIGANAPSTSATTLKTYMSDLTLTTAAQGNITSLGTLTALTVDDVAGKIGWSTALIVDGGVGIAKNTHIGGTLNVTSTITGDLTGDVTGDIIGDVSGTAATVTGAAQTAITSLGILTTLTVDNIITNGSTIGHTDDTDLLTLADGIATVAGEVSLTVLDIGGTNVFMWME